MLPALCLARHIGAGDSLVGSSQEASDTSVNAKTRSSARPPAHSRDNSVWAVIATIQLLRMQVEAAEKCSL